MINNGIKFLSEITSRNKPIFDGEGIRSVHRAYKLEKKIINFYINYILSRVNRDPVYLHWHCYRLPDLIFTRLPACVKKKTIFF